MDYKDIIAGELMLHDVTLCTGCQSGDNHARGAAYADARVIHLSAKGATRSSLHRFLHEIGHVVLGHGKASKLRRWEKEQQADGYATSSLRAYGIAVPRKVQRAGAAYVARMKRWGKNIAAGRRS